MKFKYFLTEKIIHLIPFVIVFLYGLWAIYNPLLGNFLNDDILLFDNFDSHLIHFIFERNYQELTLKNFGSFWDSRHYYPHLNTLAYSDSFITGQLFYFPLRFIGFGTVTSINITFILIMLISISLLDLLLIKYSDLNILERIIFLAVSTTSLTLVNFFYHYQLVIFQLCPAFFFLLFIYLKNPTNKKLLVLAILFFIIGGFSTYFVPMIAVVSLTFLIFTYKLNKEKYLKLIHSLKNNYLLLVLIISLLIIFFISVMYPYLKLTNTDDFKEMMRTSAQFSARPWSFFQVSIFSFMNNLGLTKIGWGDWERTIFPGISITLILFYGLYLSLIRKINLRFPGKYNLYLKEALLFFIIVYIFAQGPYYKIPSDLVETYQIENFISKIKVYLPFYIFAKIIPGVENIRAPGRFLIFLPIAYSLIIISVLRHIKVVYCEKKLNQYNLLLLVFISFFIFDNKMSIPSFHFEIEDIEFNKKVQNIITKNSPTVTLPFKDKDGLSTIKLFMNNMNSSLIHQGRTVSGYGARWTDEISELIQLEDNYIKGNSEFDKIIEWIEEKNIEYIIIKNNDYLNEIKKSNYANIEIVLSYNGKYLLKVKK